MQPPSYVFLHLFFDSKQSHSLVKVLVVIKPVGDRSKLL